MELKDTDKKNIFRTPENYFEELPSRIQERVQTRNEGVSVVRNGLAWKLALPAMVILIAVYLIPFSSTSTVEFEETAIIEYLEESDVTTAQILDVYDVDDETLASLFADEIAIDASSIENQLQWEEVELLLIEE